MTRAVFLLLLAAALAGCADRHLYPGAPLPDDRIAFIEAARSLRAGVDFTVDGIAVGSLAQYYLPPSTGGAWLPGKPALGASVLPGHHRLAARLARYGWISAAWVDCAELDFAAEPGRRYRLVPDGSVLAMMDLATGIVIARATFTECPQQAQRR